MVPYHRRPLWTQQPQLTLEKELPTEGCTAVWLQTLEFRETFKELMSAMANEPPVPQSCRVLRLMPSCQ